MADLLAIVQVFGPEYLSPGFDRAINDQSESASAG
jgi:hypothetical protein